MAAFQWDERRLTKLRTMQVILCALVMGCCMFALVVGAAFLKGNNDGQNTAAALLIVIAVCVTAADIVAMFIVPGMIASSQCRRIGERFRQVLAEKTMAASEAEEVLVFALLSVRQTVMIVRGALLEGAAFFWLVISLAFHSPTALAASVALIVALASTFPTKKGVGTWLIAEVRKICQ